MRFAPPLRAFAKDRGIAYTRYVDDLTFSSRREKFGFRRRRIIKDHIKAAGFRVNGCKTENHDLQGEHRTLITGIRLERGGRMMIPREYLDSLRGRLHLAIRGGSIDPDLINGMMSVFWSPWGGRTDPSILTKKERKVLALYEQFRAMRNN